MSREHPLPSVGSLPVPPVTDGLSLDWDVCVWSDGAVRVHECPVCHALVLAEARPYHEQWHAETAPAPGPRIIPVKPRHGW